MKNSLKLVLILLLVCSSLSAHNVSYRVRNGGITIEVWYEGISPLPMKNGFVKVFAPGEVVEFQKGRTDQEGRFSFFPDRPGRWQVVINDGNGHGIVADVMVDETLHAPIVRSPQPLWLKLLTGVSVIFGIFGVLVLIRDWKRREKNAHT
ncbi:MAG: hypothetical protein J7L62_03035 [Candidatus Aminicenantes bacterium]|nr:hypothetical protein [Candidatus Aminicenantes bacterium]